MKDVSTKSAAKPKTSVIQKCYPRKRLHIEKFKSIFVGLNFFFTHFYIFSCKFTKDIVFKPV